MNYQGRALYNLLQMNSKSNPSLQVESWQVEEYRALSEHALFERLEEIEIFIDRENFLLYVEQCDGPEELADCLYLEENDQKSAKVFLVVFELWRRLAPHKQSLSIFVDSLDHLIERYEEGDTSCEEELQQALESFQAILDDNVDEGGVAKEGYRFFSTYSCHDLEVFIFEYAAHQIDAENDFYANELLDGFYPYVSATRWFDLLKARLVAAADKKEGQQMVRRLLTSLKEEPDLYLLFETLHYLIYVEKTQLFSFAYYQALEEVKTEGELCELLLLTVEYFNAVGEEGGEKKVAELLEVHRKKDPQEKIANSHIALATLKKSITLLLT